MNAPINPESASSVAGAPPVSKEETVGERCAEIIYSRRHETGINKDYYDRESVARIINAEVAALRQKLHEAEAENVRRIRHLNRLGTWAQQDATGPLIAGQIQEWVLNELKAALGSEYKPTDWQPTYFALEETAASQASVIEQLRKALEECKDEMCALRSFMLSGERILAADVLRFGKRLAQATAALAASSPENSVTAPPDKNE